MTDYRCALSCGLFDPSAFVCPLGGLWHRSTDRTGPALSYAFCTLDYLADSKGFQAIDHRIFAYYLMQDYAHSAQFKGAYVQD